MKYISKLPNSKKSHNHFVCKASSEDFDSQDYIERTHWNELKLFIELDSYFVLLDSKADLMWEKTHYRFFEDLLKTKTIFFIGYIEDSWGVKKKVHKTFQNPQGAAECIHWLESDRNHSLGLVLSDDHLVCVNIKNHELFSRIEEMLPDINRICYATYSPQGGHVVFKLPEKLKYLEDGSYPLFGGFQAELITSTIEFMGPQYERCQFHEALSFPLLRRDSLDRLDPLPMFFHPLPRLRLFGFRVQFMPPLNKANNFGQWFEQEDVTQVMLEMMRRIHLTGYEPLTRKDLTGKRDQIREMSIAEWTELIQEFEVFFGIFFTTQEKRNWIHYAETGINDENEEN